MDNRRRRKLTPVKATRGLTAGDNISDGTYCFDVDRELIEVDVDVSFWMTVLVIPWWTRSLTSSIIPSSAWSAGDMEKKGGKTR